jgi:hypothetical protein
MVRRGQQKNTQESIALKNLLEQNCPASNFFPHLYMKRFIVLVIVLIPLSSEAKMIRNVFPAGVLPCVSSQSENKLKSGSCKLQAVPKETPTIAKLSRLCGDPSMDFMVSKRLKKRIEERMTRSEERGYHKEFVRMEANLEAIHNLCQTAFDKWIPESYRGYRR